MAPLSKELRLQGSAYAVWEAFALRYSATTLAAHFQQCLRERHKTSTFYPRRASCASTSPCPSFRSRAVAFASALTGGASSALVVLVTGKLQDLPKCLLCASRASQASQKRKSPQTPTPDFFFWGDLRDAHGTTLPPQGTWPACFVSLALYRSCRREPPRTPQCTPGHGPPRVSGRAPPRAPQARGR